MISSTQLSYRPSLLREEAFLKTFSGRKKELSEIISHLTVNLSTHPKGCKNLYIYGERGIGKTTLLHRFRISLRNESKHILEKIIPVFFFEREIFNSTTSLVYRLYEITCSDDLIQQSLSSLAASEFNNDFEKIKKNGADLYAILKASIARENKKLVLFIENFDSLVYQVLRAKGEKNTGSVYDSQELLLKLIQDTDIIFTCTGLVKKPITKHDCGWDTFTTMELLPLEDLDDLYAKRIEYDNNSRLLSEQGKLRRRIELFRYLTGGNTRLMVQYYELLSYRKSFRLDYFLDEILNTSTPLFEWMLEKFIDFKSQEIIDMIARQEGNATVKEIAKATDSNESTIRMLLHRLKEKNFLQKIDEKRDQSDIYTLKSLMFFLWYQRVMLQEKNGITDFFIHFVDYYFDPKDMDNGVDNFTIIRYQPGKGKENDSEFITGTGKSRRCIELGRFPLEKTRVLEEIEALHPASLPEIEKLIYEVVKAKKDDSILLEKIQEAQELEIEKQLAKAADLFRIIAYGYRILAEEKKEERSEFFVKSEDNIKDAIRIYNKKQTNPLEHLRCLALLVGILWENEKGTRDVSTITGFTSKMINTGKKTKPGLAAPFIGFAYKYRALCSDTNLERLEFFQESLGYFQDTENKNSLKQLILILINMGLIHLKERKYGDASGYLNKALEISIQHEVTEYFNPIIAFLFETLRISGESKRALDKIGEIITWLDKVNSPVTIDRINLNNYKAFFLEKENKIMEARTVLRDNYEAVKTGNDISAEMISLLNLSYVYRRLDEKEEAAKTIEKIAGMIAQTSAFPPNILHEIADIFYRTGDYKKEMIANQALGEYYLSIKSAEGQAGIQINNGICYLKEKNDEKAAESFKKAIEIAGKAGPLKKLSSLASFYLAVVSEKRKDIDEALKQLKKLKKDLKPGQSEAGDKDEKDKMLAHVNRRLFFVHLEKSVNIYKENNGEDAAHTLSESLTYSDELATGDFVQGFFFLFMFPLIKAYGYGIAPFFSKVDNYLSSLYNGKKRSRFIKLFNYITRILKGENSTSLVKDLPLLEMEVIELIRQKIEEAEEKRKLRGNNEEKQGNLTDETKKFEQIIAYLTLSLSRESSANISKAESLVKEIKADRLDIKQKAHFFFISIILSIVTQKKSPVEEYLAGLLQLATSGSPVNVYLTGIDYSNLKLSLKEELRPVEYDLILTIESLMKNEIPCITFLDLDTGHIPPGLVKDLKAQISKRGSAIFDNLPGNDPASFPTLEEILTISGSRLSLESLISYLKLKFTDFSTEKQEAIISFFQTGLDALPESYHCLIRDFFANTISELSPVHSAELVDSFLELLRKRKSSEYFTSETITFLQTAKYIVDDSSKEKIEKELLKNK